MRVFYSSTKPKITCIYFIGNRATLFCLLLSLSIPDHTTDCSISILLLFNVHRKLGNANKVFIKVLVVRRLTLTLQTVMNRSCMLGTKGTTYCMTEQAISVEPFIVYSQSKYR